MTIRRARRIGGTERERAEQVAKVGKRRAIKEGKRRDMKAWEREGK